MPVQRAGGGGLGFLDASRGQQSFEMGDIDHIDLLYSAWPSS
jgi:hypothetical protein